MAARLIERVLFAARWLMVFFYAGLLLTLLVLLVKFAQRLHNFIGNVLTFSETDAIVSAAAMIDLTLVASMILIVVYSGYENFVSQLSANENKNWPEWMTFMDISKVSDRELWWLMAIHGVFVVTGVLLALTDKLSGQAAK